jgi:hypothetical protein
MSKTYRGYAYINLIHLCLFLVLQQMAVKILPAVLRNTDAALYFRVCKF